MSPIAKRFLLEVAPQVARELWDEIAEIERDPAGRGQLIEGEDDPEFAGLRVDLAVPGFAVFYLTRQRTFITSIRPWDFPEVDRSPS